MRIELNSVSKHYRGKRALDDISLQLDGPKIYALLGKNGAGKTTLLNLIAGHLLPSSGEIRIEQHSVFDQRKILKHICFIKEKDNFHPYMRVGDIIQVYRRTYKNWNQPLIDKLLNAFQLPLRSRVKTLSKGMRSSLSVAVGLASGAAITIFDEPYIGMDASARQRFYDLLLEVYELEERMLILSTHLIDEASLLFQEVIVLKDGKLLLQEEADYIRSRAYAVTGKKELVEAYCQDKKVLKTKELNHMMKAYLFDTKEDLPASLTVEGIPFQETMIYLSEME